MGIKIIMEACIVAEPEPSAEPQAVLFMQHTSPGCKVLFCTHLIVHLRNGLLALSIHVQDLKECLVHSLVLCKPCLQTWHNKQLNQVLDDVIYMPSNVRCLQLDQFTATIAEQSSIHCF